MSSTRSVISVLLLIVCLITCSGATFSLAQGPATKPDNKPEDQVTQLERDWLAADANGDRASLRRIISDDFIGSSFDGGLLTKRDIIPEGPSAPGGFAGATPGETNVRVFGDTAVLMASSILVAGHNQSQSM
jgi:uncharacterized protein DUF4440